MRDPLWRREFWVVQESLFNYFILFFRHSWNIRSVTERPREPAHWDTLREINELHPISIPIIGNGDIFTHSDIAKMRKVTGLTSVMIARGAALNPAIFSPGNTTSTEEIIRQYLRYAVDTDDMWSATKYGLLYMTRSHDPKKQLTILGKHFSLFVPLYIGH